MDRAKKIAGCTASEERANGILFTPMYDGISVEEDLRRAGDVMETYSPYQRTDLSEMRICFAGSPELPSGDALNAIGAVESIVGKTLDSGMMSMMIACDHLLALGAIQAAAERYQDLCVVHFGAFAASKRDDGGSSHTSRTLIRRVWEQLGDRRIYQFGVRSGSREEFEWCMPPRVRMERFWAHSVDTCAETVASRPVYITVEMSVVDPSEYPATRTPNAGGTTFSQLHDALMSLNALSVVGFDICGYCPELDTDNLAGASMIFKLFREMACAFTPASTTEER